MEKEFSVYDQLTRMACLPVYFRLLKGAMELDLFSKLKSPVAPDELAEREGWNKANTQYLLGSLSSIGFVKCEDGKYANTEETERYLSADSPDYAGGFLLTYMQGFLAPMDVAELVQKGPNPSSMEQMNESLDFTQYGEAFRAAQRGCRQQEVLRIVRSLPENSNVKKVLDIGCNTGLLGLAVIGDQEGRSGVLFDMPPLVALIKESAAQMGLEDRIEARGGNFMTDDLGDEYDLVLAVSVLVFAKADLPAFLKKVYDSLAPGGVVVSIGEGIHTDLSAPWDMIMGYLPYMLQGMDMSIKHGEVEEAARIAGFSGIETRTETLCSGTQDIVILRK